MSRHVPLSASVPALVAFGCSGCQPSTTPTASDVPADTTHSVNTKTADALREALMDERRAYAFYTSVMSKHGQVRPFSNIVNAEVRHAAVIESLMTRHGIDIPNQTPTNLPAVPSTLAECSRLAASLERENIAMYDRLLVEVTQPDIRAAFQNLRDASKNNHLPAFERWAGTGG